MSYDLRALYKEIELRLASDPRTSLCDLARGLKVGRRSLEKAVKIVAGTTFRQLRQDRLLKTICRLLSDEGAYSIKQISFEVGYKSPRSLARFIRKASGYTATNIRANGCVSRTALLRRPAINEPKV